MNLLPLILLLNLAADPASKLQKVNLDIGVGITINGSGGMVVVDADIPPEIGLKAGVISAEIGGKYIQVTRVDPLTGLEGPPLLGRYSFHGGSLSFSPVSSLGPGGKFMATITIPGKPTQKLPLEMPGLGLDQKPSDIQSIYPTSDRLPANLLKFYVYFSRSMRETADIFNHMHILDQTLGVEVEDPWRRQSMWSDDGKRLTVLIHPGRIKKGVNLREELGPVLRPDHRYTLVIDADILDADGKPLGKEFRKHFQAIAEDAGRPALDRAQIAVAQGVLKIDFQKPMDHALLARMIRITDAQGNPVAGRGEIQPGESVWMFTPAQPWKKERYTITVDEDLEDLSGNTPSRVFDADLENPDRGPIVLQRVFTP